MLFNNRKDEPFNAWMSYTDLLSALTVLFIVVSVIIFNQWKSNLRNIISEYDEVFYEDELIQYEINRERGSIVITHKDTTKGLFAFGSDAMSDDFEGYVRKIGKPLVEKSMSIWEEQHLNDMEMRIEGHTDPLWKKAVNSDDAYINNLMLSSARANYVYKFIIDSLGLNESQKDFVKKNMISIGYSYSKRLNEGNVDDRSKDASSRTIEFRIISK